MDKSLSIAKVMRLL